MSLDNFSGTVTKCVVYGDHITYANRDGVEAAAAGAGFSIVEWVVDHRSALDQPLTARTGAVRALVRALAMGAAVLVADVRDVQSRAELLKYAAAGMSVGVDVRTLNRRVLDARPCTDEMDFALLTILRGVEELRGAVLSCAGLAAAVQAETIAAAAAAAGGPATLEAGTDARLLDPAADVCSEPGQQARGQALSYLAMYRARVAHFERSGLHVPPLPGEADAWPVRRRAIGVLARHLSSVWFDREIAVLLNEAGVTTPQGGGWYAQRVTYYRRAYGGGSGRVAA